MRRQIVARVAAVVATVLLPTAGCRAVAPHPGRGPHGIPPFAETLDDLIAASPLIVAGMVQQVLPTRLHESLGLPVSVGQLRVDEVFKGSPRATVIRVRQLLDAPERTGAGGGDAFQQGEQLLLFLGPANDGTYGLVAVQGGYRLRTPGDTLTFIGGGNRRERFTLADLRERVRRVPDRSGPPPTPDPTQPTPSYVSPARAD